MEIKDLLIFQSVARNGSISKAAEELCYVQSHVTARIKALEASLKTKLFHRHSRGTTLNSEGKRLLEYSEKILTMIDELEKEFHDSENPSGTIEIGTVETVMKLPLILSAYHTDYPDVDISLKTGVTEELLDKILNRKLDGAFVTSFGDHPDIEQIEVFREELVLISDSKRKSMEELIERPLLVFNTGCGYRARLEQWIQDEGVVNAKVMEFGTLETILGSVVSGLGISLVPRSTISHLEVTGTVQTYEISKEYSDIKTVFIRHADTYLTNTMKKFIETVEEFTRITPASYTNPFVSVIDEGIKMS